MQVVLVCPGVQVVGILGPGDTAPDTPTAVTALDWEDTDTVLEAYLAQVEAHLTSHQVVCSVALPPVAGRGQVALGGCGAGVVLVDSDHRSWGWGWDWCWFWCWCRGWC